MHDLRCGVSEFGLGSDDWRKLFWEFPIESLSCTCKINTQIEGIASNEHVVLCQTGCFMWAVTQIFFVSNINLSTKSMVHMFYHSYMYLKISLFICRARHTKLQHVCILAVIWTHDLDPRGMGLFSILCHKLLCIPIFKEILRCKAVCDVKSRTDPCLWHYSRGSKFLLVLPVQFLPLIKKPIILLLFIELICLNLIELDFVYSLTY